MGLMCYDESASALRTRCSMKASLKELFGARGGGATPEIWCEGPILQAVHHFGLYEDCKDFVDSPLRVDPAEAWKRWNALPKPVTEESVRTFIKNAFGEPGSELLPWSPPDYRERPELLNRLPQGEVRKWAKSLNSMWSQLGRTIAPSVRESPGRSTLLLVPNPLIVPGGRFREGYYWDSYWIILGLLSVGMRDTARGMVDNMLHCVKTYGFVPNGLRTYYLNRSQPPLLTQMVGAVAHGSSPQEEESLLSSALPLLEAEYAWWMRGGDDGSSVTLNPGSETVAAVRLNRYVVRADGPRPESWRDDVRTAERVSESERARVYNELATAAESGWDFSSRWLPPSEHCRNGSLAMLRTSSLLPVDLNAILYRNEVALSQMHARRAEMNEAASASYALAAETAEAVARATAVNNAHRHDAARSLAAESECALSAKAAAAHARAKSHYYAQAAEARRDAMRAHMWDPSKGVWFDVEMTRGERQRQLSLACFTPLWAGVATDEEADAAVNALRCSKLIGPGGAATTRCESGQQWDWPNAWPPLQQMIIEGLEMSEVAGADELAREMAHEWLVANWKGWKQTGNMHEKYDAGRPGERGAGGEYAPQVGFGWTNGVVLWLLERYGASVRLGRA